MGTSVRVFAEALCFSCREDTDLPSSIEMASNKEIGEKYGLHPRDVEKIKFAFEVYDFKGDGKVDGFYIGDLIRACNINPTNKTIDAVGGQKEKAKGLMTELCDPQDDDGFTPFMPFLERMCKSD